jgi:hypothetical protein
MSIQNITLNVTSDSLAYIISLLPQEDRKRVNLVSKQFLEASDRATLAAREPVSLVNQIFVHLNTSTPTLPNEDLIHRSAKLIRKAQTIAQKLLDLGLPNRPIPEEEREVLISYYATQNRPDLILAMLASSPLPDQAARGATIITLLRKNPNSATRTILEPLLAPGPISEEDQRQALELAAISQPDVVLLLLFASNRPISDAERNRAVFHVARFNIPEIMSRLLASGPTSVDTLRTARIRCSHPEIRRLLEEQLKRLNP